MTERELALRRQSQALIASVNNDPSKLPPPLAGLVYLLEVIDDLRQQMAPVTIERVPPTHHEAVTLWGADIVTCSPEEWEQRTTQANASWLLETLYESLH